MQVVVSDKIYLIGATDKEKALVKNGSKLVNPMFFKMKKMGKPFVHLKENIEYYEEDKRNGILAIGRGHASRLKSWFDKKGINPVVTDLTSYPRIEFPKSSISLRPYQKGVPETIALQRNGVCRFDTGYGKTILALKVAELLQTPTLIIVPRTNIYEAFKTDIKKFFGFEADEFTNFRTPATSPFTLATIQALQRATSELGDALDGDYEAFRKSFGLIIVDECHLTVPAKSRGVVECFTARYRFGFTATPRRTDGQGDALSFIYGPIIADGKVERETPQVEVVKYQDQYDVDEYHFMVEAQTNDNIRRLRIADIVAAEAGMGRRVLVLTKRVAAYESLAELLIFEENTKGLQTIALTSEGSKGDRAKLLTSLRDGDRQYQVLLGTFSLLSTGVDIPSLDTLIIAGDLKSDVLTEQSAGRILRLFDGKMKPKIIDIQDVNNPIFWSQARARLKFYREVNWPVSEYGK